MRRIIKGLAALGLAAVASLAHADDVYRIIVPSGPGTGNDVLFRAFAPILADQLKATVVVDNRSGADGALSIHELTRSPADGHTLLATTDNMLTMNFLLTPYDPKAMKPIAWLMKTSAVLVTRPDGKYKTIEDFLAAAKAKPESVTVGIGAGVYRFALALLERETKTRFREIPYNGSATNMLADLWGGSIDATMLEVGGALAQIKAGRLKPLAVFGSERSPTLPDTPAVAGIGYPGFAMNMLFGLSVSSATPDPVAKKIEAAVLAASQQKAMKDFLGGRGQQVYGVSNTEVAPTLAKDAATYKDLAEHTDILKRTSRD